MESASNLVLFCLLHHPGNPCQPQRNSISPSFAEIVDRTQEFDFPSWLEVIAPDDREPLLDAGRKMLETFRLDETVRILDSGPLGQRVAMAAHHFRCGSGRNRQPAKGRHTLMVLKWPVLGFYES